MPDNRYAQKGPTKGGDDDSSGKAQPQEVKPLDLRKYINKPDVNVRDLFWSIMRSYAANEKIADQLKNFHNDRLTLVRIAVSVVKAPERYSMEDMEPNVVAEYTLRMVLDAGWYDAFVKLITETYDRKSGVSLPFLAAIQATCKNPEYLSKITRYANDIILENFDMEGMLAYIAEANNSGITKELKKELIVLATEGIDQSQHYAIFAIAPLVSEDEEVKRSLFTLLRSWDDETRRIAANVLKNVKDKSLLDLAKRQAGKEEDEEIKELLKQIVKNNEA